MPHDTPDFTYVLSGLLAKKSSKVDIYECLTWSDFRTLDGWMFGCLALFRKFKN